MTKCTQINPLNLGEQGKFCGLKYHEEDKTQVNLDMQHPTLNQSSSHPYSLE